jgi:hypothetical protein
LANSIIYAEQLVKRFGMTGKWMACNLHCSLTTLPFKFGDAMGKVLDHPTKKKSVMSVNKARQKNESPATDWASAVAMLRAMNKPMTPEVSEPLPEDFSASDFDIVRARRLSGQI